MLVSIVYLLGILGTIIIGLSFYRLIKRPRYYLSSLLFRIEEDEPPFDSGMNKQRLKALLLRISRWILKSGLFTVLLSATLLSWFDILLYSNRELKLNIQWLSEFYGPGMTILKLSYDEIWQSFSYLNIFLGSILIIGPLLAIVYFKYEVSKIVPKRGMMTGLECFIATNEIRNRFYSSPFSLMSRPRKTLRKILFELGALLILTGILMHVYTYFI